MCVHEDTQNKLTSLPVSISPNCMTMRHIPIEKHMRQQQHWKHQPKTARWKPIQVPAQPSSPGESWSVPLSASTTTYLTRELHGWAAKKYRTQPLVRTLGGIAWFHQATNCHKETYDRNTGLEVSAFYQADSS